MLEATGVAILMAVVLYLIRAILGPTVYDRILALNALGTKTVLLVALVGTMSGRGDYVDIALLYALVNFVATIAVLKMVRHRNPSR